jgi:hypothetical protein
VREDGDLLGVCRYRGRQGRVVDSDFSLIGLYRLGKVPIWRSRLDHCSGWMYVRGVDAGGFHTHASLASN